MDETPLERWNVYKNGLDRLNGQPLTPREVNFIRYFLEHKIGRKELAKVFNVSFYTIRDIARGNTHKNVEYQNPYDIYYSP